jgi:hypothetical protein
LFQAGLVQQTGLDLLRDNSPDTRQGGKLMRKGLGRTSDQKDLGQRIDAMKPTGHLPNILDGTFSDRTGIDDYDPGLFRIVCLLPALATPGLTNRLGLVLVDLAP